MAYDTNLPVEPANRVPLGRLTTANAVIDALGGTKAVADLLGVGASSVSNYRRLGFPARAYFTLAKICQTRGLDVADAVFGGVATPGTSAKRPAARASQTATLSMFTAQGFEPCHSPIMQPAGPFIDRLGEEMRRRLYLFTDPGGEQLCLRPDLTIPTALAYLANNPNTPKARLAYEGLAFRYQSRGAGKPEEFYQAGIEILASPADDHLTDEADVLKTIVQAVEAAGVQQYQIIVNNLTMFSRFLAALDLSQGTTKRLERAYHQSANFDAVLQTLLDEAENPQPPRDIAFINGDPQAEIVGRTIGDINARILRLQSEADAGLTPKQARAIVQFMKLSGPIERVLQDIETLLGRAGAMAPLQDYWQGLLTAAELNRENPQKPVFLATAQGRKMAYYTGLAFEIHVPALNAQRVIASGGRYDDLLQSLGAPTPLAAVGGAIALERLRAASQQQGGAA